MRVPKLKIVSNTTILFCLIASLFIVAVVSLSQGQTLSFCNSDKCTTSSVTLTAGQCGIGQGETVKTSIAFGCKGDNCLSNSPPSYCSTEKLNPIVDVLFAIIRFLSDGVGIVIILSIIIGGIQYIASRGEPHGTQAAIKRITSALLALIIFIFAYAILNYVIPNSFFQ